MPQEPNAALGTAPLTLTSGYGRNDDPVEVIGQAPPQHVEFMLRGRAAEFDSDSLRRSDHGRDELFVHRGGLRPGQVLAIQHVGAH